jgi:hypothetical protein
MTIDDVQLGIDCGNCGSSLWVKPDRNGAATVHDGEEVHCIECGSANFMTVDENEGYVSHWTCKHGVDDETPCQECDPVPIGKCPTCYRYVYVKEGKCGGCQQY